MCWFSSDNTIRTQVILVEHVLEEACVDGRQRVLSMQLRRSWARVTAGIDAFTNVGREGRGGEAWREGEEEGRLRGREEKGRAEEGKGGEGRKGKGREGKGEDGGGEKRGGVGEERGRGRGREGSAPRGLPFFQQVRSQTYFPGFRRL